MHNVYCTVLEVFCTIGLSFFHFSVMHPNSIPFTNHGWPLSIFCQNVKTNVNWPNWYFIDLLEVRRTDISYLGPQSSCHHASAVLGIDSCVLINDCVLNERTLNARTKETLSLVSSRSIINYEYIEGHVFIGHWEILWRQEGLWMPSMKNEERMNTDWIPNHEWRSKKLGQCNKNPQTDLVVAHQQRGA